MTRTVTRPLTRPASRTSPVRTAARPASRRGAGRAPAAVLAVLTALLLASGVALAPAASAARRENREVTISGREPVDNRFVVIGKVTPTPDPAIHVRIEIKDCKRDLACKKPWRLYSRVTTKENGRYRAKVRGPKDGYNRVYYRAHVVRTAKWQADFSREIYIHRVD
ncbi:hypothetical protein [Nocardioides sp. GY 10127]|uniref:hypothetical protein n=1 Tax=Nocardioides sp. GY 10127 TaxID=2569762 RepID=UPI0010A89050|nr:hypothetical protein [Nocardioides sp. GY 10127]TIC80080.1 hypothetical protein E8D37_15825 [Nocardioides sp. GY 10127]